MSDEARTPHPQAIPNYQHAVISRAKLEDYVLNSNHDKGKHKALVFKSALGFEQSDWELLRQRILAELPFHPATIRVEGPFGKQYEVILPIEGVNLRIAEVITGWVIRPENDFPNLVSARVRTK